MAGIEPLVDELERSYADAQERMSDPAVFADRNSAAEVGRRLKDLEGPWKLAQEWRAVQADLADASDDADLAEMVPGLETRLEELEEELKLALIAGDPDDSRDVIVEVRQGVGGDEAALWAGDVFRMLQRYAERRGLKTEVLGSSPVRRRRLQGGHVRREGRRRVLDLQVGRRARIASSASPRPSPRGASTPPRRPWRRCPRPRRSRSRSTRTT